MDSINELAQEKLLKQVNRDKKRLMDSERAEQDAQYKSIIEQKNKYAKRSKHDVKDDVKYGVLPKSALLIEPMHKIGVPTGAITSGVITCGDAMAFLTMSDKKLCEYYANYDNVVKERKQSVANIVKAVDRQDESFMSAKAGLESEKLKYSTFKTRIKLQEKLLKASNGINTDDQNVYGGVTPDSIGL